MAGVCGGPMRVQTMGFIGCSQNLMLKTCEHAAQWEPQETRPDVAAADEMKTTVTSVSRSSV